MASPMMTTPGSIGARPLTRAITYPPLLRSSTAAPGGPNPPVAARSPRAASRATSRAASIQRTCKDSAVAPARQSTAIVIKLAMASAASTVLKPPSAARPEWSVPG